MNLLVSMGDAADEGTCRLVCVDLAGERATELLNWLPPMELRVAGKGFMGIAWSAHAGLDLLACAHSAVCRIDARKWTIEGVLHQACMNDLHHLVVVDGRVWLVNTGTDRIDVIDLDGRYLGGWVLEPAWLSAARLTGANPSPDSWRAATLLNWEGRANTFVEEPLPDSRNGISDSRRRFSIRKVRDFVHPNHIAVVRGRPLITRFHDCSIQDLSDWSFVVPRTPGYPHDGEVWKDEFWITCTNGVLAAYALEAGRLTSRVTQRIDLYQDTGHSGWCRGLIVTDELLIVGLNAIVETDRTRWCERPFEETETSIIAVERATRKVVARVDMSHFGTLPKLFGILPMPNDSHAQS